MSSVHDLSPAAIERLSLLVEELGEVQQSIGKILRHGFESYDPTGARTGTNRQWLQCELGDVCAALRLMELAGDLAQGPVGVAMRQKLKRVQRYLHEGENVELALRAIADPPAED